ncbi:MULTISPECIES: CBS domain-containing protein [Halomonadaceae]|jgi:CBS-domain-containing membrane protein|uniref:CBS domain-containing protein n=1 Tax=Billgrantia aerodenitrificans TaxID=2733483 RepID=A0ABS9AYX6_9GAMM|nr:MULTISPECIES: CBS domain-containing protein [Halomonas]MCE8026916.1 CBS domain-containing protein [Halomonas aerodenitrificans]MCE8040304.1 CBS domain-containing protein [Halomonas sp. MCCC 1A11062]
MKTLPLSRLDTADHLVTPQAFSDIDEHSPALSLMTDFRQHWPHAVSVSAPALEVARQMKAEGVSGKLVIDRQRELVGMLTLERLSEQSILVALHRLGIDRSSLTAGDLMQPRAAMPVVDYEAVASATVTDLVATLREAGEPYCLVRDAEHHIRGLFSVSELSERLHRRLSVKPKASIIEVLKA